MTPTAKTVNATGIDRSVLAPVIRYVGRMRGKMRRRGG